MIRLRVLFVPALMVAALVLAGCQSSASHGGTGAGGSGDTGDHDGYQNDPWLTDDPEMDAVLATGEFQGLTMVGLSCEQGSVVADSEGAGDGPSAYIVVTPDESSIHWDDAKTTSADGTGPGASAKPGSLTVSVDGTQTFDESGGGQPWSSTATLTIREVPVPDGNGCDVADIWVTSMVDAETPGDEVFRAMTEDGLVVADSACTAQYGYQWLPPNMSCGDVAAVLGD